jgi:hypothetical protein
MTWDEYRQVVRPTWNTIPKRLMKRLLPIVDPVGKPLTIEIEGPDEKGNGHARWNDKDGHGQAIVSFRDRTVDFIGITPEYADQGIVHRMGDVVWDHGVRDGTLASINAEALQKYHQWIVRQAVREGWLVPEKVMRDYPDVLKGVKPRLGDEK